MDLSLLTLGLTHVKLNSSESGKERFVDMPFIIAMRCGYLADDTVELLCLKMGERCRYRLFLSTMDLGLDERLDDLDAVEFDSVDANEIETFLIESLWRLEISPIELGLICTCWNGGMRELNNVRDSGDEGFCGTSYLLSNVERQLCEFEKSAIEPVMLRLVGKVVVAFQQLPYLSDDVRNRVTALQLRVLSDSSRTG